MSHGNSSSASAAQRNRDEAELRESDERYRLVGRITEAVIWDWNIANGKLVWGEGIRHTFGYPCDQVRSDRDWWSERIHPEDLPQVVATLDEVLAGTDDAWSCEYRFLRMDGSYADAFDRGLVIRDVNGTAIRMIGSVADFTKIKQAEESLREAKDAAEAASRAKSEFLASMSHELRTPLNSVIGFANVLGKNKTGNLREQDLQYLDRVRSNGKHLLGLIDGILDLSKIEAGKMELEIGRVALDDLVCGTLDELKGAVRDREVELRALVPEGLPTLDTDGGKLKQVLINRWATPSSSPNGEL